MKSLLTALYSAVVYLFFSAVFLYAILFVEGIIVPKTIDSGPQSGLAATLGVDVLLLGVFAIQHSVMARPGFKRAWTKIVPEAAERSTYVLLASLLLALLCWQWRPLPQVLWSLDGLAATVVVAISWAGWGLLLASTFLISHFHLFGLNQGFAKLLGLEAPDQSFVTPLFYRWIRHPLYAGFVIAFWAAPVMSVGHLFFAVATTGYILIGIWLEERDMVAFFGNRYIEYRRQVGMLIPRLSSRRSRYGIDV